jgi:hypothetical protein
MPYAIAFAAGALTVAMALPAGAQEFKPPANLFGQPKPAFKPYIVEWGARPSADQKSTAKPTIVCGMTLVPADPEVDPRMRKAAPDAGVTFTLRAVPPAVCKTP